MLVRALCVRASLSITDTPPSTSPAARLTPVTTIAWSSSGCAFAALPGTGASAPPPESTSAAEADAPALDTACAAAGENGTTAAAAVAKSILRIMRRPGDREEARLERMIHYHKMNVR